MSVVPIPGLLAGGSERALRVVPILLGFVFLFSAWRLAARLYGRSTAAWTVALVASSPQMATHSSELLSDFPSASCLLFAMTVLVTELSRPDGPRWRLLVVAPLAAGAFYIRYGSCVPVAVIGVVFLLTEHRAVVRRPMPVIATALLLGLLLAPHIVRAVQLTGAPLGILRVSAEIPGKADGLLAYVREPMSMYGPLVAAMMLVGLLSVRRDRTRIALQLIALAHVCVLAWTTQAQPRFIYLATVLLVILGVDATLRFVGTFPVTARRFVGVAAVGAVAVLWANTIANGLAQREQRYARNSKTHVAAAVLRQAHDPRRPCEVIANGDRTRLEWYSGCRAVIDPQRSDAQLFELRDPVEIALPPGARRIAYLPGVLDVIQVR